MIKNGLFISVEGADGSGKSSMIGIMKQFFEEQGHEVVTTREPGGTGIAEQIRNILVNENREIEAIDSVAQLLLFYAARIQHIQRKIIPALEQSKVVISDRFHDSSVIYQGKMAGVEYLMNKLNQHREFSLISQRPDVTFFFDVSFENSQKRSQQRGLNGLDKIYLEHQLNMNNLYRDHFKAQTEQYPNKIIWIDANHDMENVQQQVLTTLSRCREFMLAERDTVKGLAGSYLNLIKAHEQLKQLDRDCRGQ